MILENVKVTLNEHCYLDLEQADVVKNGLRLSMSRNQYRLVYRLAKDIGHPVHRDTLIAYVWGIVGISRANTLHVCVHRIRELNEDDVHHPKHIIPVKGMGYILLSELTGSELDISSL